jgi:uncharacterized protein YqgC (DUF456 family)
MRYQPLFIIFFSGLAGITLIDTAGALTARILQVKYAWFSIFSFLIYTVTGYYFSRRYGVSIALYMNGLLGLFDGTIGFWLSIKIDGDHGLVPEAARKMLGPRTATMLVAVALVSGMIGYGISNL